jgi:diguanylate cyclase (GGDEF)-like protein
MGKTSSPRWLAASFGATSLVIAGLAVTSLVLGGAGDGVLAWGLPGLTLATCGVQAVLVVWPLLGEGAAQDGAVSPRANLDPLTQVFNRVGFLEQFDIEASRAQRYQRPLGLLRIEVDHLKRIIDAHGRVGGDAALRGVATLLRTTLRSTDIVARFGEEVFTVLLPETDLPGAALLGERLRGQIARLEIIVREKPIQVTVSIGVTQVPSDDTRLEPVMRQVERLTGEAKRRGRNRIVTSALIDG